jgi:hypothetical protein
MLYLSYLFNGRGELLLPLFRGAKIILFIKLHNNKGNKDEILRGVIRQ